NENVGKQRAKPSYYGGDKFDADDEESQKLCINDCRQKQTALYPPFYLSPYLRSCYFNLPDLSELFVMTGQSRINLYLQQSQNKVSDTHKYHGDSTHSNILNSTEVDLVVCKLSNLHVPPFPRNLSSEVSIFRSHGLPCL
ncbi:hypothetical protein EWB00_000438, partial [Schistosoma japonicum]